MYLEGPLHMESKEDFWEQANLYNASGDVDESFLNEIAYLMVTIHRTGT